MPRFWPKALSGCMLLTYIKMSTLMDNLFSNVRIAIEQMTELLIKYYQLYR